jgi:hypothetical protein
VRQDKSSGQKVETYFEVLAKNRLADENIARRLDYGFLRYFAIVAGFPVFIAGYLINLIPFVVPRFICHKYINDLRFYSSVYVSSGTVLYLIYFPVLLILAGVFFGWTGFIFGLLAPIEGYLVLFYLEIFRERFKNLRYLLTKRSDPKLISELAGLRDTIFKDLG